MYIKYDRNTFDLPVTYKAYPSKKDARVVWYVGQCKNEADHLYCQTWNHEGLVGRTITIDVEGVPTELYGPWVGNAYSLFLDTGYDCKDKHLISYEIQTLDGQMLFAQYNQIVGFYTAKEMAELYANQVQEPVRVIQRSYGGGFDQCVYPIKSKPE